MAGTKRDDVTELSLRAKAKMEEEKYDEALTLWQKCLEQEEEVAARNNAAVCHFLMQRYDQSIETLKPNLDSAVMSPFARALASNCAYYLGNKAGAQRHLKEAIRQFDWGVHSSEKLGVPLAAWQEYTVMVKRAAGLLEDHELILELHKRWQKHYQLPEDWFQVGVALFNLGRYKQAVKQWQQIREQDWRFVNAYQVIAKQMEAGVVPPFLLEYHLPSLADGMPAEKDMSMYSMQGTTKALLLSTVFGEERSTDEKVSAVRALVGCSGEWGWDLGRRFLTEAALSEDVKMAAAHELLNAGAIDSEKPLTVVLEGKTVQIQVQNMQCTMTPSPEAQEKMKRVHELTQQHQFQQAKELTQEILAEDLSVPVLHQLGQLHCCLSEYREAQKVAETLFDMAEHPSLVVAAAELYFVSGAPDKAVQCINQIDRKQLSPRWAQDLHRLEEAIGEQELYWDLEDRANEAFYNESLDKALPPRRRLRTCLRNLPGAWLDGMCAAYDLDVYGRRKDREDELHRLLCGLSGGQLVEDLDGETAELLHYVVQQGGWVPLALIEKKYGRVQDDNFWWAEDSPETAPGYLCWLGLLFMGTMSVDGQDTRGFLVANEILIKLQEVDFSEIDWDD